MLNALILVCMILILIAGSLFYPDKQYTTTGKQILSAFQTQTLSGLAIFLIVVSHIGNVSGVRYFTPFGNIGVGLFLMLSGYGLSESFKVNGLEKYFTKRIKRVLIPYWITIMGLIFYRLTFDTTIEMSKSLKYLIFIEIPHVMYWFLYLIVFWYLLFYVINKFIGKQENKIFSLFIISLSMLFISQSQLYAEQAFSFFIGSIISYKKQDIENILFKPNALYVIMACCILISGTFLAIKQIHFIRLYLNHLPIYLILQIPIIIFAALSIILFVSVPDMGKYLKGFRSAGNYSYEIYLSHVFIIPLISPSAYFSTTILFVLIVTLLSYSLKRISKTAVKCFSINT